MYNACKEEAELSTFIPLQESECIPFSSGSNVEADIYKDKENDNIYDFTK